MAAAKGLWNISKEWSNLIMKLSKLAFAAAVAALLWGPNAMAEDTVYEARPVGTSVPGVHTVMSDDQYADVPAHSAAYSALGGEGECACEADCGPNCCKLADLGDPFKLFDGCWTQSRGITAGGWLAQSFTWNPQNPTDRFNGPVTWTDRANEYQMNEFYLFAGKAANTEGCGWDYGWRVDALYGSNYRWDTAAGLETNINNGQFYGLALPNLYGEVAYNDVTVKLGHFTSPVGFFAVGTANNFFPTLPYTFQYGEPFTHTGMLATWKISDKLSWGNGFTHGWDNFDNTGNPHMGYIGTLNYTFDNNDTLAWVGLYGQEPTFADITQYTDRYLQTLVYTRKVSDDTSMVFHSDFGSQQDSVRPDQIANWYGLNSYLFLRQTCRTQYGLNFEWFRDENGARVGAALPSFGSPGARGYPQPGGFNGNFFQASIGAKHFFTPNIYARAQYRADWYGGSTNVAGNLPYDDGTKTYQNLVILDLVMTF